MPVRLAHFEDVLDGDRKVVLPPAARAVYGRHGTLEAHTAGGTVALG